MFSELLRCIKIGRGFSFEVGDVEASRPCFKTAVTFASDVSEALHTVEMPSIRLREIALFCIRLCFIILFPFG
jgi:hypothetical protein